jgi:sigma-B regulation protein RsbU (phosphoserine phosphatase)
VSGKGVAAALLMANLQALFRTHTDLATINRLFRESTPMEQYATVFFGIYEDDTRTLRYINCGHPPPVVRRANGTFDELEPTATVIGLFSDWTCTESSVRLEPGDVALIYSDGVCEAGEDTARSFIVDMPATTLAEAVAGRCSGADQYDDVTVVVLRAV